MCGQCGLAGDGVELKDLEGFETLLWLSALRGPHSTGVMTYTPNGGFNKPPIRIHKTLAPAPLFLLQEGRKKFEERVIRTVFTEVFMGHCRWATVGDVNENNAHPFDTGNLVSTHNGTLTDQEYSKDKTKTDSQMMFEAMEQKGVLSVLSGLNYSSAYAVVIFDKKKKTLTFARETERPLSCGISRTRRTMLWASETAMLEFINTKHKLDLEMYTFEPHKAYTVKISAISNKNHEFFQVEEIKRKSYTVLKHFSQGSAIDPWGGEEWCCQCGTALWSRALDQAKKTVHDGVEYFKCRECLDSDERYKKEKLEKGISDEKKALLL